MSVRCSLSLQNIKFAYCLPVLYHWVQSVISSLKSGWRPGTSNGSQGSELGLVMFNISFNDLNDRTEHIFSESEDDIKTGWSDRHAIGLCWNPVRSRQTG